MSTPNFMKIQADVLTKQFISGIRYLDQTGANKVLDETKRILSKCSDPTERTASRSVLVFGEVQSGKTLSFTTSMTLAKENGVKLIVVLAGTKKNLRNQTFDRLVNDLGATGTGAPTTWKVIKDPRASHADVILEALRTWDDPRVPIQYRVSPVIVVMKTKASLNKLEDLIRTVTSELGSPLPVIFVDDEADQAGLNVAPAKETDKSAVNGAIVSLRASCENHTYLMYTATAQALGLVDLEDEMSPDYVVVLESGDSYVSGKELFSDRLNAYFLEIPDSELGDAEKPKFEKGPVPTLRESVHYFLLAACVAQERGAPTPLSMLVHPATSKASHGIYVSWIRDILKGVADGLSLGLSTEERLAFFDKEFGPALEELEKTIDVLAVYGVTSRTVAIGQLTHLLPYWVTQTQIREINSGNAAQDISTSDWRTWPLWILVGGAKLERGFTVENLTVTYMPRSKGGGLADTIQQRGRFFGHKRPYIDLLRGWFSYETFQSFRNISEMEAHLRDQLMQVEKDGITMKEWVRNVILVPGMAATRKAVISLKNLDTYVLKGGFRYFQTHIYGQLVQDPASYRHNYGLLQPHLRGAVPFDLDTRSGSSRSSTSSIPVSSLISLLDDWAMADVDKRHLTGYLLGIQHYADLNPGSNAKLVFMDELQPRKRSNAKDLGEVHSLDDVRVNNLHQGQDVNTTYLGDRHMQISDAITVQFHNIVPSLERREMEPVLAIAISWPIENSKLIYIQKDLAGPVI